MCITCFAPMLTDMVQAEASIAMHPSNPHELLVTTNGWTANYAAKIGTTPAVSTDEGLSWIVQETGTGGNSSGDPAAGIDVLGNYYNGYNSIGGNGTHVARSVDAGTMWSPIPVDIQMMDRPHLFVDVKSSPNVVYVASAGGGAPPPGITDQGFLIRAARSIDQGLTYIDQQGISEVVNVQDFGVDLCAGPGISGRNVYATWVVHHGADPNRFAAALEFNKSTNKGVDWLPSDVRIDSVGVAGQTRQKLHVRGHNKSPRLSDSSKYPLGGGGMADNLFFMCPSICADEDSGDLWIIWTNKGDPLQSSPSNQDVDIYVIRSTDLGATWALPVKVNQDPVATPLSDQWFPRIASDEVTGRLVAAFYDSRNHDYSQNDHGADVFLAVSDDGGTTWEDLQVSDGVFTPTFVNNGNDYIGLVAGHGRANVAWADDRSGPGAASMRVYTSRVLLWGPVNSSLAASYTNVPGNTIQVTVTWQTNMAAAEGDRVFLESPSGQQYTSSVCTTCTSNGTSHSLTMSSLPCELGYWEYSVESAETFGTSRQSASKTFKVLYCLY